MAVMVTKSSMSKLVPILAALILALVGCGAAPAATQPAAGSPGPGTSEPETVREKLAALETMSGDEREQFLVEQAAQEPPLVMYSGGNPDLIRSWQDGFAAAYPEVQVEWLKISPLEVVERFESEKAAGQPVASLINLGAAETAHLLQSDVMVPYVSPESADFADVFHVADDEAIGTNYSAMIVAWNTDRTTADAVPTTLEGLADPALRGQIGRTLLGSRWVAAVLEAFGEEEGMKILEDLSEQDMVMFENNTVMQTGASSGTVPIVFDTQADLYEKMKQDGAPVDWAYLNPLFVAVNYLMIPDDAPSPYGAALAWDWIISVEGQEALNEYLLLGPRTDMDYAFEDPMRDPNLTVIPYSPELLADIERYQTIFEDLFLRRN